MSGLKTRNRRGRPQKNTKTQPQHKVEQVTETMSHLELNEPLFIVRSVKDTLRDNQPQAQDNQINSDNGGPAELLEGVDISRLPKAQFTSLVHDDTTSDDEDEEDVYLKYQEEQLLAQNISQIYKRPESHYVHYIQPSDLELYDLVEYDMDEQDKQWLNMYNRERRSHALDEIPPYLFEYIMDKLEKEWFNMIKNAPKPDEQDMLPEDSACAVCDDTEVENSNAIVFCDGCNVAVHQDCYGIPYIPEGQWLCRKCMISPEFPVSCLFCPNEGGAFKQTNTNQWGHLLCAIWIPEVGVSNAIYMEPIDAIENVPKSRWKLTCSICRNRQGACIQCDYKHCFSAFHVTCAKAAGLCMRMNSHTLEAGVILKAYCEKHTPKEFCTHRVQPQSTTTRPRARRGRGRGRGTDNKVARAHQHHYSTGVPIVPDVILSKIDHLPSVKLSGARKRQQVVTAVAHYWSLKRESRRGAPLLKRLHLEPWTATAKYKNGTDELVTRKLLITQLRSDLDKVRMLSEQVQKRERQKLERTRKQKDYLQMILFPLEYVIQPLVSRYMEVDRKKYFLNPVTEEEAPGYRSIIQQPMCFTDIQNKLALHEYLSLDQFAADIELICQNAMTYNASDTRFYKVANKLKAVANKSLLVARAKLDRMEVLEDGSWNVDVDPSIFAYKDTVDTPDHPVVVQMETEEEKQQRLERDRVKEEERQRIIRKRIEGRAKARALRQLNPVSRQPTSPARSLRTRSLPIDDNDKERQVTSLQIQHPEETQKRQRSPSFDAGSDKKAKVSSAIGWVYLDDEEEEGHRTYYGSNKTRQSRNGIPVPDFERGDIVWARVDRFPSHPAKFLNLSDEEAGTKLTASRRYQGDVLVEFLKVPEMHRYGWVGRRTICKLGHPDMDRKRLSEALGKRPKRNVFINEAKEGYRYAGSLIGVETESMLHTVFDLPISKKRHHHKKKL